MSNIQTFINNGINQDAIDWAKKNGQNLADGRNQLTTSQLRRFFGELKRIQNLGYEKGKTDLMLLQAKLAYAVGRARRGNGQAGKIESCAEIISEGIQCIKDEKQYLNFMQIVEALVAYHKYYEGVRQF